MSFRSEKMVLCQLILPVEAAYACLSQLGEMGVAQFNDLNYRVNAYQRSFISEVLRCQEMERQLRYLRKEVRRAKIPFTELEGIPTAPLPHEVTEIEAVLENLEDDLREVKHSYITLTHSNSELLELKYVLRKAQIFFEELQNPQHDERVKLVGDEGHHRLTGHQILKFRFLAGVIPRERIFGFERMLWRACRGNVFIRQAEIEILIPDPVKRCNVHKSAFILFFQGEQLKSRVKKICEGFHAKLYPCPEKSADRRKMAINLLTRIEDLQVILGQTEEHKQRILSVSAKYFKDWFIKIKKVKSVYHTLNKFNLDVAQKYCFGECWVPLKEFDNVRSTLLKTAEDIGCTIPPIINRIETSETPPTFNPTNKYTSAFQTLINAYGVGSYQEVNPMPYTIITFPFLFSIMFGDIGHGLIMFIFASWMVLKEKELKLLDIRSEIWDYFFGGRYIIILMGIFSIYTGFIYNDIFSKSLNIFGSSWSVNYEQSYMENEQHFQLSPSNEDYYGSAYPLGFDPVWQLTENKIIFQNSFKMKISIIVGITQMVFGVVLSLWNHIHFKHYINIFCDFIPQLFFLCCIFMYMVSLMFMKWVIYYPTDDPEYVQYSPHCAPLILITFINMVLFKDNVAPSVCDPYMYSGQQILQKVFILFALICVPWMLILKPCFVYRRRRLMKYMVQAERRDQDSENYFVEEPSDSDIENAQPNSEDASPEEMGMAEMFIYQGIHTVEYVLGSVSHTASYLRLWALSLAHGQLSDVLWNMVLRKGLTSFDSASIWVRPIFLWLIFSAWASFTVAILVLMEGLSAFLHCLRLHWVEFQSKFYAGSGVLFAPFSFRKIFKTETIENL